jgi:hypothetical protein
MMTNMTLPPVVFSTAYWGDEMILVQERADAKYLRMSRPAWEEEKRLAKVNKRFRNWNDWLLWVERIDNKRLASRRPKRHAPTMMPLQSLLSLRDEYVNTPGMHFSTEAARVRELRKIEAEICAEPGGKQALGLRKCRETELDVFNSTEAAESDSGSDSDSDVDIACFIRRRV